MSFNSILDWVTCLAITSDDHYIVSGGSKDRCLKIFNLLNKSQKAVIENAHQGKFN